MERAGLSTLNEGQQVEYEIVDNRGKSSAENLKHGYTRILRGNPNKGKTHMWRLAGFVLFAVVAGLAIYVSGVDADKKPEKKRTVDDRRVEGLWGEGVYE